VQHVPEVQVAGRRRREACHHWAEASEHGILLQVRRRASPLPRSPVTAASARPRIRLFTTNRLLALVLVSMVVAVASPIVFITSRCYGEGFQPAMRRPAAARDIPNYTRDEAYSFWALPHWI